MKPCVRVRGLIVAEVLLATLAVSERARADPVTHWNEITLATQAAVPAGIRTPTAARALAMVHLAIFDAVNSIDRRFAPYAVTGLADRSASPEGDEGEHHRARDNNSGCGRPLLGWQKQSP